MVYKTYINKFNTIRKDSPYNTSLNPISELVYGHGVYSRALLWFDENEVRRLIEIGAMPYMEKMKHTLHITNAGSLDFTTVHDCGVSTIADDDSVRATSFDLIFFLIPHIWDEGKGFDYTKSFLNKDYYDKVNTDEKRLVSIEGCNWYHRRTGLDWDACGIYTNEFLSKQYDKFSACKDSVIIARQRFQVGNENIDVDITDTFNKFLTKEYSNYGIGIAFTPMTELREEEYEQYLGLLTNKTSTWYAPYVETRYDDSVDDSRNDFALNKMNKIYLYSNIGDDLKDLDENPTVTIIDGNEEVVKDKDGNLLSDIVSQRFGRGIYFVEFALSSKDYEPNTMLYDVWKNISYNGIELDDAEMYFTTMAANTYFKIGKSLEKDQTFSVSISGIQERERILRGDVRKLTINAAPSYTQNTIQTIEEMDIRIYVKDGEAEIDFISWDKVNKAALENFYLVDTNIFLPQRYYVDVRIKYGMSIIVHHDVLQFDIVEDKTNKFW